MVIMSIAGVELTVLVGPTAALIVMALACAGGVIAYERTR